MLHFNNRRVYVQTLVGSPAIIGLQIKKRHICGFVLLGLLTCSSVGHAQTPIPSPSPAPTPITKTGVILVDGSSTVGRITKWVGSTNNGTGTIGNSVITESSVGTIGIGTNPFSDFKLGVDGGNIGGLFGRSTNGYGVYGSSSNSIGVFGSSTSSYGVLGTSSNGYGVSGSSSNGYGVSGVSNSSYGVRGISGTGVGVFGQSNSGPAGFFQGNVNVTGLLSTGSLSLNPGGNLKFADGTIQTTAFTGQISQSQVTNLIADLSSKANNSGVVHLTGTETITGAKTFSGFQLFSGNVGIGMHGPTTDTLLNVGGNTGVVAGTFINNHNTSENDALYALHTGRGNAFHALNTQVIGRAGFFENSHTNSSSPVLEALGHGPGPAFKASNTGTGPAAVFTSGNVGIGTAAPQAKFHVVNAGGTAGQFDGNVTINGNLTLTGSTNISPSVNHDSTLSGNGSSGSPLAVVSAPNGVVTTGIYANPSWITSLDGSKVAGTVANATNSVNATTASTVSVPLNLSGTNNVITITGNGGVPNLIVNSTETGGGAAIEATNAADNGSAILARNSANGYAILAESSGGQPTISSTNSHEGGGAGMFGRTLDSTGNGIGVYGYADFGRAIFGEAFNGGNAVEGLSHTATGVGINGRNDSGGLAGRFEGGDVYVKSVGKGIILSATDGPNCFRITVDNTGQLTTALVTCPP
jgi:hypothetical protein